MAYNEHIKQELKRLGLTRKEVAAEMEIVPSYLSQILAWPMTDEREAAVMAAVHRAAKKKTGGVVR